MDGGGRAATATPHEGGPGAGGRDIASHARGGVRCTRARLARAHWHARRGAGTETCVPGAPEAEPLNRTALVLAEGARQPGSSAARHQACLHPLQRAHERAVGARRAKAQVPRHLLQALRPAGARGAALVRRERAQHQPEHRGARCAHLCPAALAEDGRTGGRQGTADVLATPQRPAQPQRALPFVQTAACGGRPGRRLPPYVRACGSESALRTNSSWADLGRTVGGGHSAGLPGGAARRGGGP